jgi:hypothetical protein
MPAPAAALFAASGPATPSIAPWPSSSRWRETFRSTPYEANDAIVAAGPGMRPTRKPTAVPRSIGGTARRISSRLG